MLANSSVIAFVATEDAARAKLFYQETLGLELIHEDKFACVFNALGTMLRVVTVKQRAPVAYTVLGWEVTGIEKLAEQMLQAGVKFETYPGLEQDASGIWSAPGGDKVAWFKDPDGNVLSISQHASK